MFVRSSNLFVELDEFKFQAIEDLNFLMIKQFLIILYPNILKLYIENVVQNFFYFVLCFKTTNWRKRRVLCFILDLLISLFKV